MAPTLGVALMDAVRYRFRAELRSRWRAWVGLALIVGLIAGTVILLAAGSRRTGSAYDRFLETQHAYDVGLVVQCEPAGRPGRFDEFVPDSEVFDESCIDEVAKLPAVADATRIRDYPASVTTEDGVSLQPDPTDPCYSGPGQVVLAADPSGRFGTSFNESRIVAGRRADPAAPGEVVIAKDIADRLGLGPGDTLRMQHHDGADRCLEDPATWRTEQRLRVVGVGLTPGEVAPPSGLYLATVNLTPAFARDAGVAPGTYTPYLLARLHEASTLQELERQAERAGFGILPIISAVEQAELLEDGTRPVAFSLALIAALVALAGVAVLGQILVRQAYLDSSDRATLAALGLKPSRQFGLAMLRAGFIGVVGAGVAAVVAVVASPLMPVSGARDVEPSPGIDVDPVAVALGISGTLLFVVVVSAFAAWRLAGRTTAVSERGGRRSRAVLASAMAERGIAPVPVAGVRFALDRGSGIRAVPVWSSLVGLGVAATTLVAAVTFGAGLTYLLDTPRLVGWNWDVFVGIPGGDDESPEETVRRAGQAKIKVEQLTAVDEFAAGTIWPLFPQGRELQLGPDRLEAGVQSFDSGGTVGPSVIAGRAPRAPDELLLGPDTLEALGLGIGDMVSAFGQSGTWEAPGAETSARMRIVGTGVVPTGADLGRGATMTLEGAARLNELAAPDGFYVRRAAGVDNRGLREELARELGAKPTDVELIPEQAIDPTGKLRDLRQVDDVPIVLGALMALMAAAVLAHVLVSSIGQHRRDLALLRTLGFTPGQVSRTLGWQASTYVAITLAVSLPLGIALGRSIWRLYAEGLGVVPEPVTPWGPLVVATVATFVIANLIAAVPAWRASRAAPAANLRTE